MNGEQVFDEYIKAEKYRISLSLGECRLDPAPVVKGNQGVMYKARLNGYPVALKFIFPGMNSQNLCTPDYFRKEYTTASLMEYRKNQVQYLDFDTLRIGTAELPVLVMKPCKSTLADCRSVLSPGTFVKLFHFLTTTVRHLTEQKLPYRVIDPCTILVDADNDFVLADLAVPDPSLPAESYLQAIGQVLQWYTFGDTASTTARVSSVFPSLAAYDQVVRRSLSPDSRLHFRSLDEVFADVELQKENDQDELMREFSLICRKNFPKELPEFVHCTDQRKISKLMADFVARNDFFGHNIVYFTDCERNIFSPQPGRDGFFKFDNSSEFRVLDLWIHSDNNMRDDYILVHHANTLPEKVNGKDVYKWAVYDGQTRVTWEEAMNGFAEVEGDIVPLDKTKIEFYNRIPHEGYFFIALSRFHSLPHPANLGTLRDYFFRFSFNYVNRYILEDMNNLVRQHTKSVAK